MSTREAHAHAAGFDVWWSARPPRVKDLLILGLYVLLTVIFFAPFLFSDRMLFGTDIIPMGYAARKLYADYLREHHAIPLWNPYILGGLPFCEALHGDIFYPASLLYLVFTVHRAIGMKLVLHVLVAGAAMYTYLRTIGLRRGPSAVGGAAYMFAPYFISLIYAGHDAKMYVTALFPFLTAGLERIARGRRLRPAVAAGIVIGLMLLSSHVQMAYFALWGAAIYTIALMIRAHRAGRGETGGSGGAAGGRGLRHPAVTIAVFAAVAVAIGLAIGLVQVLPPYLYTRTWSPRAGGVDYSFASSWSLHPEEVVSLALPEFGGYQDSYWGRNPFKLNMESPGTLVMLLALVGLAGFRRRWPAAPAAIIAAFALLYALGAHTPVHRLFFAIVPGVKFFRAPSIIMFLFSWGTVTLAAMALDRLLEGERAPAAAASPSRQGAKGKSARARPAAGSRRAPGGFNWRAPGVREFTVLAVAWWGIFIIAAALRGAGFDLWTSIFYRDIAARAREVMHADVAHVLAGLAVTGIIITAAALALRARPRWGRTAAALVVLFLVVADGVRTDRAFVKVVALTDYIPEDPMIDAIRRDPDVFRVLPVTGQGTIDDNYFPVFGIQTANGFHDNRMASYDLILRTEGGLNFRQLALMNVKYVVTARPVTGNAAFNTVTTTRIGTLSTVQGGLPRAFVVHHARVMEDPAAVKELLDGQMPLDREIVLARDAGVPLADPPPGSPPETVTFESYDMREARLRVHASAPGFLYMGDNYYPAWHPIVDGKEAPLLRANISFRAIPLAAGDHEVVMRYHSPVVVRSMMVSAVAGFAALAFFAVSATLGRLPGRRRGARATSAVEAA